MSLTPERFQRHERLRKLAQQGTSDYSMGLAHVEVLLALLEAVEDLTDEVRKLNQQPR
jgi:hypothetical protein